MKATHTRLHLIAAAAALALTASIGMGQSLPPMLPYTWTFPNNGHTTNFPDPSWIYWFNIPGGNMPVTNDVSQDVFNDASSGSLIYSVPFVNASNTQDVIFGTFGNQFGYDTSASIDIPSTGNINFWIRADPGTAPRQVNGTNVDYGTISTGFFFPYSFETEGSVTIPLSASNAWVHLTVPVNPASARLNAINGVCFDVQTFGTTGNGVPNYPALQNSIFYLDNVQVASGGEPVPPTFGRFYRPITGFNATATSLGSGGQQFYREQIVTAADTGYSFIGQNATYSWTIKSFPTFNSASAPNAWQAHFFIVNGAPGQFDQPADYNLSDVLWFTVSAANPADPSAGATLNFRMKTNEPFGNGMVFNTTSPTDTVNNPNGWLVEPIAALTDPNGPWGTWSINIQNNTNITVTSPFGFSTNFNITPAQAALFADPVTLILGGQPNNTNGIGQSVVYSSFTASGVASSFTDNFLTDTSFNTNIWKTTVANDTNGVVLVPGNAAFWLPWTLPDGGYTLVTKADLNTPGGWTQPNPLIIRNGSGSVGHAIGVDEALILSNQLPSLNQGYFQLIQYHASMLQVLFAGQTNAPGTTLGYTGSPTPISGALGAGATATVTVNAVDSTFHIDTSINDLVQFTSSADPDATEPANVFLNLGTVTVQVLFTAPGSWTVTAADLTNSNPGAGGLTAGTSVPITVNP